MKNIRPTILISVISFLIIPEVYAESIPLPIQEITSSNDIKIPAPEMEIEDAIKAAKKYIIDNEINTEGYYLQEVKHIRPYKNDRLKSVWHVLWRKLDLSLGTDISLFVHMDGSVKKMPTM